MIKFEEQKELIRELESRLRKTYDPSKRGQLKQKIRKEYQEYNEAKQRFQQVRGFS